MPPMELLARQQLPRRRHHRHRRLQPLLVILGNLSLVSTLYVVKPVMLENTQTHPQPRHARSVWLANMPTTLDQPFAQIAQWGTRHLLVHLYARNVNQENTLISRGLAVAFCVLRVRTLKTLRRAYSVNSENILSQREIVVTQLPAQRAPSQSFTNFILPA